MNNSHTIIATLYSLLDHLYLAARLGVDLIKQGKVSVSTLLPRSLTTNLLVTSALSISRVAFNSLRIEPAWVMSVHAADTAAAITHEDKTPVQRVNAAELQRRLREA